MSTCKRIVIMNENIDYHVKDKIDCVNAIIEEYHRFDVSMSEILASIEIQGFSAEDVVDIYASCVQKSDNDTMVRFFNEVDYNDIVSISDDNFYMLGL